MENQKDVYSDINPGEKLFEWEAFNYHPHKRGIVWISVFCLIFFGSAIWALLAGDWFMSLALFLSAAVYFLVHRKGDEPHTIQVFQHGLLVDKKFVPFENLKGYWFVYDETVSVINFQFKGKRDKRVSLQMGKQNPGFFRKNLSSIEDLPELESEKERLIDLWIRVFKL